MSKDKNPFIENQKFSINYLYYIFLFTLLVAMTTYNIFLVKSLSYERFFFLIHALGQCVLEFSLIIFFGCLIQKHLPKICHYFYIGLLFLFFLSHPLDFILNRILDLSFWETMAFVFDENWENFMQMLYASGIPLIAWGLFFLGFILIPFGGVGLYLLLDKLSEKKQLHVSLSPFIQSVFCTPIFLILWDFSASVTLRPDIYHSYLNALPWKSTFIPREDLHLSFNGYLKKPQNEKEVLEKLVDFDKKAKKTPNIFLFVVESLREDFITKKTAPNLYQFKQENLHFSPSFSNANATQNSWFSLFYSTYPLYWGAIKNSSWTTGATPLRLLKKLGYKIHVFSSAELYYYNMDELIFGKSHHLADSFYMYPHHHPVKAAKSDKEATEALQSYLKNSTERKEKNLFVIFLDSTHFDYSWSQDHPITFFPISGQLDYFKAHHSKNDVDKIQNRYKNAISYVDSLFLEVTNTLKKEGLYDNSVIVFTGDHGEEFYENGKLFHASHLSKVQTEVPLYFKLGTYVKEKIPSLSSHMDIFPTIFHHLFENNVTKHIFEGNSCLDSLRFPFVLTARYNASRAPYEFFLHNGTKKLLLRFRDKKNIFSCKKLEILSLRNKDDQSLFDEKRPDLLDYEFKKAFIELFPSIP